MRCSHPNFVKVSYLFAPYVPPTIHQGCKGPGECVCYTECGGMPNSDGHRPTRRAVLHMPDGFPCWNPTKLATTKPSNRNGVAGLRAKYLGHYCGLFKIDESKASLAKVVEIPASEVRTILERDAHWPSADGDIGHTQTSQKRSAHVLSCGAPQEVGGTGSAGSHDACDALVTIDVWRRKVRCSRCVSKGCFQYPRVILRALRKSVIHDIDHACRNSAQNPPTQHGSSFRPASGVRPLPSSRRRAWSIASWLSS